MAAALGRDESWTAALLGHRPTQSLDALDPATLDALTAVRGAALDPPSSAGCVSCCTTWTRRPQQVLALRLGFADGRVWTLTEVALRLGISVARVRRLEARALDRLRDVCPQQASAHL